MTNEVERVVRRNEVSMSKNTAFKNDNDIIEFVHNASSGEIIGRFAWIDKRLKAALRAEENAMDKVIALEDAAGAKPPLGLMPRDIHRQQRACDIVEAMGRYVAENKPIKQEWLDELAELYGAA